MRKIESYKGVDIFSTPDDKKKPITTVQSAPVIGVLQVGHNNLADAKKYIDTIKK